VVTWIAVLVGISVAASMSGGDHRTASFILGDQVLIKVIGLGLATAVLFDATVVRMVLVPATMELLGDRNWWLPRWLDRLLPHVDVEGADGASADRPTGTVVPVPVAGR
jgi:RND superfamily putative drug exporter